MVKMSHSGRKRLVPSKVKVKESRVSDVGSVDENHDHGIGGGGGRGSKGRDLVADGKLLLLANCGGDVGGGAEIPAPVDWLGYHPIGLKKEVLPPTTCSNNNSIYNGNGKQDFREQSSPLSLSERSGVNPETGQDETSSNGNKDDEEDDDDESEDKIDTQQHDPERLKAFNMFVRLFVDENLDRMVPISKQPKEKIQAIIDSCTRQFPEFAERARKRIRTYLKSCRRNKRSRDSTWESSRPTPAHLTSVQAEQILAQACENESQNAKRMRMGLEPVGQPLPLSAISNGRGLGDGLGLGHRDGDRDHGSISSSTASPEKLSKLTPSTASAAAAAPSVSSISTVAAIAAAVSLSSTTPSLLSGPLSGGGLSDSSQNHCSRSPILDNPSAGQKSTSNSEKNHLLDYSSRALNGNGVSSMSMYRPNFCQAFSRPAPFPGIFAPPSQTTTNPGLGSIGCGTFPLVHSGSPMPIATNGDVGPTDLSMKSKPLMTHTLNGTEMATVRQLITGYRESAAFLLRSADELEQLLIQQQ